MKSLKNIFFFLLFAMVFVSCGKYADGQSVWAEGAWILPWLLLIGAGVLGYFGYISWKSGTQSGGSTNSPGIEYSEKRLPVYKVWQWVFAAILLIVFIVVLITQNADK
jgi:hypothetical protein